MRSLETSVHRGALFSVFKLKHPLHCAGLSKLVMFMADQVEDDFSLEKKAAYFNTCLMLF
jgi:hypothetical protein